MPRPPRYNADYYTHLADLRNDRRVKAIRTKFGAAGYGVLHMLLEALTDADFTQLDTDPLELELLAGDFGVPDTEINSLIQFAEKIGYFTRTTNGMITCPDLVKWLDPVFEKRNRARDTAAAGQKSNAPWLQHAKEVYERDEHKCRNCGSNDNLTLDHIIPRSAGGSDEISNLQTLCGSCNSSKGAKPPITVTGTTQSKVKESKGKKSIGGGGVAPAPPLSEIPSPPADSVPAPAAAPPLAPQPPAARPTRTMPPDEAPIFQRPAFSAYLATLEEALEGKPNVGYYLTAIQGKAETATPAQRTDAEWRQFIFKFLSNDKKDGHMQYAAGSRPEAVPAGNPHTKKLPRIR